ncbi:hypothetical protein B0H14DRAFT_2571404 [Mycena olivaceomarginata]|nr:hypothetical protein B0H14DRAFT_2571404 [Mycena olivaceomarginata]
MSKASQVQYVELMCSEVLGQCSSEQGDWLYYTTQENHGKRQPKLADNFPDTFPDLGVIHLYLDPLTSRSPGYTEPMPDNDLLGKISTQFYSMLYADKAISVTSFSVRTSIYSCRHLPEPHCSKLEKPQEIAVPLWIQLNWIYRVRVSTANFVQLANLDALSPMAEADIELVSIPKVIVAVAMRDTSLATTDRGKKRTKNGPQDGSQMGWRKPSNVFYICAHNTWGGFPLAVVRDAAC